MFLKRVNGKCLIILALLCLTGVVLAVGGGDGNPDLNTPQESLKRWQSLRVGVFVHWTPYVLATAQPNPAEGKRNLYKKFRAEKFDPEQWVQLFKEAGFKYVVFTTKHGDDYCMWDTKESELNLMNTLMKRDVVGELVAECRKQNVEFCPYYAMEIARHPDFTRNIDPDTGQPDYASWKAQTDPAAFHLPVGQKPDYDRYVKHLKAQMKELTENYGPFLAWWFDQCAPSWNHAYGTDLYAYMRSLQSDVLVSNRVDTSRDRGLDNPTWFVTEKNSAGDYALSEIAIPRFNREIAWEHCRVAGIEGRNWFWNPNDVYRPLNEWIMDIINSACRDGNFILGIGAMPDGRYEPRLVDQLRQLGVWLEHYGESIYGTHGGPFKPNSWYGSTCRGNNVYLHISKTDNGTLILPPIDKKVLRSRLLNGGKVDVDQTDEGITVTIGIHDIQPTDTIVVLELDGSAEEITPVEERSFTAGVSVRASNVRKNQKQYASELATDDNPSTYWTTDEGIHNGWLEYDLGKDCTFSRAILDEGDDGWIRHVQIQTKTNNEWKTVFEYRHGNPVLWKKIPMELFCPEFKFDPVTAQFVRVNIISATKSPVVREFKLYER